MKKLIIIFLVVGWFGGWVEAAMIGNTEDPYKIAIGARSMGMGGVYAAVVDSSSNMFNNPAGMYGQQLRLFSMSATLLGDVNYLVLGGNWPLGPGCMGLGYAGSGVGSIITTGQSGFSYFDYHNNVTALSYAWQKANISMGARVKFFDQGFSGSQNYAGNGFDCDFGLLIPAGPKTNIGLVLQNFLPVSMGGRINWPNGDTQSVPYIGRVGFASRPWRENLLVAADVDFTSRVGYPPRLHGGAEWTVNKNFQLRGGLDQVYSLGTANTEPTAGVSLLLGVFSFDYAYHPYFGENGAITHYFSLAYSADNWPKPLLSPTRETVVPTVEAAKVVVTAPKAAPTPEAPVLIGFKIKTRIFHYFSYGETLDGITLKYYGDVKYTKPLAKYNGLKGTSFKGRKFIYIAPAKELEPLMPKPAVPGKRLLHYVSKGDTLRSIALKYYGSADQVELIMEANGLKNKALPFGQYLVIPPLLSEEEAPPATTLPAVTTTTIAAPSNTVPAATTTTIAAPTTTIAATTVTVPTTTTLAPAAVTGPILPQKTVYYYPSQRETLAQVSIKYYGTDKYAERLGSINNVMNVNSRLSGMTIKVPPLSEIEPTAVIPSPVVTVTSAPAPVTTTTMPSAAGQQTIHAVTTGDTLASISMKYYGSSDYVKLIMQTNGLKENWLTFGQALVIPPLPAAGATVTQPTVPAAAVPAEKAPAQAAPASKKVSHYISRGDTLRSVAEKYYGDPDLAAALGDYNDLPKTRRLVGVKYLTIPPLAELKATE